MQIDGTRKEKFGELKPTTVFIEPFSGQLSMKICGPSDGSMNAVGLHTGFLIYVGDSIEVMVLDKARISLG